MAEPKASKGKRRWIIALAIGALLAITGWVSWRSLSRNEYSFLYDIGPRYIEQKDCDIASYAGFKQVTLVFEPEKAMLTLAAMQRLRTRGFKAVRTPDVWGYQMFVRGRSTRLLA